MSGDGVWVVNGHILTNPAKYQSAFKLPAAGRVCRISCPAKRFNLAIQKIQTAHQSECLANRREINALQE